MSRAARCYTLIDIEILNLTLRLRIHIGSCPRLRFAQSDRMIAVETTPAGIRVTIPTGEVDPGQLDEVLSWLQLESATRRSAMSEAEADAMAESGKAQWWAENKSRFIKKES